MKFFLNKKFILYFKYLTYHKSLLKMIKGLEIKAISLFLIKGLNRMFEVIIKKI